MKGCVIPNGGILNFLCGLCAFAGEYSEAPLAFGAFGFGGDRDL